MKTNELMLNDWIYHRDEQESGQVYEIRKDLIEIDVKLSKRGQACWVVGEPEEFEGIPLTKEIILLNAERFSNFHGDFPIPFWKDGDKFFCGVFGADEMEVEYVHEVQSYLRAIGFYYDADKFKIK